MNKKKAIDYLIAQAVCGESKLFCEEHCPFFKEEQRDDPLYRCDAWTDENIVQAVKVLTFDWKYPCDEICPYYEAK